MAYTARFDDVFTDTNGVDLDAHAPTGSGNSWTRIDSSARGGLEVQTNAISAFSGGGLFRAFGYTADITGGWADDQESEATGILETTATAVRLGTRIADDGAGFCDGYSAHHSTNSYRIYRVDSGSDTQLGVFFDATTAGTEVIILRSEGTTHTLREDGTERINVTDATYSSGDAGLIGNAGSVGAVDNFVARDQAPPGGATLRHPIRNIQHLLVR